MHDDPTGLTLVLVRHGESTWNERQVVQGQTEGARLTELGQTQSLAAATSLFDHDFDALYTSDLARAVETAWAFTEVLGLVATVTTALRERSFGVLESRPVAERTPEATGIRDGVVVDATASPARGESLDDLYGRVGAFVEQLHGEGDRRRVLLVTHGGTVRAIRAYCTNATMTGLRWDPVANASVWPVEFARR